MFGKNNANIFLGILIAFQLFYCAPSGSNSSQSDPLKKITFDLANLNENGLYGPPDGKVALSYEFCIPAKQEYAAEVQAIDPTVMLQRDASGRIGCTFDEYLCLGSTHQKNFKEILFKLARLDYVKKIEQSFFEN